MIQLEVFYLNCLRPEGHRVQASAMRGLMTIHYCLFVSISTISPLVPALRISESFKSSSDVLNVSLKQLISFLIAAFVLQPEWFPCLPPAVLLIY